MDFWRADDEVKPIADELIASYRPQLADCNISYIFKEKAGKKGSKLIIATAKKVSPKENVAHSFEGKPDIDFIIEIGMDAWTELDMEQKRAVIFHELCHCERKEDDEGNMLNEIAPHDVEEFSSVIEKFGSYTVDIQKFVETAWENKEAK